MDVVPTGYHSVPTQTSSNTGLWVVVVIVVIAVIALVVWIFWESPGVTWKVVDGASAATDTFSATGRTIYVSKSPITGTTLTLTDSVEGSEFIIDNSAGLGNVTIASGVTVSSTLTYNSTSVVASNVLVKGKVSQFIWTGASTVLLIS